MSAALAHRRGGKHRVRDADKTHTEYDDCTHKELVALTRERRIFRKDATKREMAHTLAKLDRAQVADSELLLKQAVLQRQKHEAQAAAACCCCRRRRRLLAKESHRLQAAQAQVQPKPQRPQPRQQRIQVSNQPDTCSETTLASGEVEAYHASLRATQTRTWAVHQYHQRSSAPSTTDTASSTTTASELSRPAPDSPSLPAPVPIARPTLYGWGHGTLPPAWPLERAHDTDVQVHAMRVPYVPVSCMTTKRTRRAVRVPVGPNPVLSAGTIAEARRGNLVGELADAEMEPATLWRGRTHVNPSGMLWFDILARAEVERPCLREVYARRGVDMRRIKLEVKGRGRDAKARRSAERKTVRARAELETYKAMPENKVGYMPAGLGGEGEKGWGFVGCWYIRLKGDTLPRWMFWEEESERDVEEREWDGVTGASVCLGGCSIPLSKSIENAGLNQEMSDHGEWEGWCQKWIDKVEEGPDAESQEVSG